MTEKKKFYVFSSETVYYCTEVEAENEEEAEENFWAMDHSDQTLRLIDSEDWKVDFIENEERV